MKKNMYDTSVELVSRKLVNWASLVKEELQAKRSNRSHYKSPKTLPLEPILIPKLRIYFADFPYLSL
jgi:hypothetical protein